MGSGEVSKSTSAYLNLLRIGAATAVVLYHLRDKHFVSQWIANYLPPNGTAYVMIFFVLSGFVVSMMAERREWWDFAVDRAVRIYIVALPVIVICTIIGLLAPHIAPGVPTLANELLSAVFLNQSWRLDTYPFTDGPYWSLSYEVFYYVLFASAFYFRGMQRIVLLIMSCALAGPKILILFPCWIIGAFAYKFDRHLPAPIAIAIAVSVPVVAALVLHFGLRDSANRWSNAFFAGTESSGFIRDLIVALTFALHLWAVKNLPLPISKSVQKIATVGAGMSFSLYLLHLPTLYVLNYFIGNKTALALLALPKVFIV
jgi:peptidoglycan/LPS O-acetylase OafA/YrhL